MQIAKYDTIAPLFKSEPQEGVIIYDDSYKESILSLMKKHTPPTDKAVKLMLDDNGYIGRYKVYYVGKPAFPKSSGICIYVTLPVTGLTYRWPKNGYYNLNTKEFSEKWSLTKGAVNPGKIAAIYSNVMRYGYDASLLAVFYSIGEPLAEKYLSMFDECKVNNEYVQIKEEGEFTEYFENALGLRKALLDSADWHLFQESHSDIELYADEISKQNKKYKR